MLQPKTKEGADAVHNLRQIVSQIHSPYNDGYMSAHYKRELFILKHLIDQMYQNAPTFTTEKEWEQELLIDKLKQS
jgi:hypothetical protein